MNRMPTYANGRTCPPQDSLGMNISKVRNSVVILTGTDQATYCYNIEDIRDYIMEDTDFPTGFMYQAALPYPAIISQILPQIQNDAEFTGKLGSILNPPPNAAVFQPPAEFLRLIKRLGQCLYYFNNKGTAENAVNTLTVRLQRRGISAINENTCRTINFAPYVQAIASYLEGVDEGTRSGIRGLIFKGYKGRSKQFNEAIERGNMPDREITFGEYIDGVFQRESCMGTTASNLINFYNTLQRNRNHPELVISTRELIANSDAARFCPRVEYTTNLNRRINSSPLFSANEGGKRTRSNRSRSRSRSRNRKTISRKTRYRNRK